MPAFGISDYIEFRLLGNISVPIKKKLTKGYVCPKNGEGEHELSHNVIMFKRDHLEHVSSRS